MATKYKVLGKEYTKSGLIKRLKEIRQTHSINGMLLKQDVKNFVIEAFKVSPQRYKKRIDEVRKITVDEGPQPGGGYVSKSNRCFWLHYNDGTKDNISSNKMFEEPIETEEDIKNNIELICRIACRNSLQPLKKAKVVEDFSNTDFIECPKTGKQLQRGVGTHLDHAQNPDVDIDTSFAGLFEVFWDIVNEKVRISDFKRSDNDDIDTWYFNSELEEWWREMHDDLALLEHIDAKHNMQKGRK
jgi:hypothetical protein